LSVKARYCSDEINNKLVADIHSNSDVSFACDFKDRTANNLFCKIK